VVVSLLLPLRDVSPYQHRDVAPDVYRGTGNSKASILYFIVVTLLGMYIIMSLFIAILLEKFACQDDMKFEIDEEVESVSSAGTVRVCVSCSHRVLFRRPPWRRWSATCRRRVPSPRTTATR
jgi:hypothetical protein